MAAMGSHHAYHSSWGSAMGATAGADASALGGTGSGGIKEGAATVNALLPQHFAQVSIYMLRCINILGKT